MARLVANKKSRPLPRGVRVVIDARPMQEPSRGPLTAHYLDHLLRAFAAEPLPGEQVDQLLAGGEGGAAVGREGGEHGRPDAAEPGGHSDSPRGAARQWDTGSNSREVGVPAANGKCQRSAVQM